LHDFSYGPLTDIVAVAVDVIWSCEFVILGRNAGQSLMWWTAPVPGIEVP
jgi:hypothetical protein